MCRAECFLVQDSRNLGIHHLQTVQLGDPLKQPILIGMLRVALDLPLQPVLTDSTGLPANLDPDVTAPALLIERNVLDDQSNDLLAVS